MNNFRNVGQIPNQFPNPTLNQQPNPLFNQNQNQNRYSLQYSTNELFNSNITQKSLILRKLFKSSIKIYEKLFKNHTHSSSEENIGKNFYESFIYIYLYLPYPLCLIVFQKLMPFILNCFLQVIVKSFVLKTLLVVNPIKHVTLGNYDSRVIIRAIF